MADESPKIHWLGFEAIEENWRRKAFSIHRIVAPLVLTLSLGACASTASDIEAAGIDRTITLAHPSIIRIAKCTQFELLSNNPNALAQVSRGIGDRAEISENGEQARVWGPSTGYPMYSIKFSGRSARISAQSMPPYSKAEIIKAVTAAITLCDQQQR